MVEHRTSPSDDRAQPVESARSAPWGLPAGATTRARRYAAGLDRIGLFTAVLFFLQSLAPSLLPRDWVVQSIVSGIGLFGGYGVGVAVSWTVRTLRVPSPPDRVRAWISRVLGALSAVTIPVFLWMSAMWQSEIRHAVGMEGGHRHHYVCVLFLSALIAMALLETARGLRWLWRILDRRIRRILPPIVSGAIAAVVVAGVVVAVMNDVVAAEVRRVAESTFSASDELTAPDIVRPTSADRSGAPGSLVPWDTLGKDGRTFVGTGPSARDITALTGRPAVEPIRVYVGRASADTPQEQADLVVAELRRTHADRRAVLAVAGTTGRGWIPPGSVDPLEYTNSGDTAVAAMQYSYFPSWVSFLVDSSVSQNAGRVLFDTVHAYWASLPAGRRPKLVAFGSSLGAFGTMSAFDSIQDITARTDAALFIGPPHSTDLWRSIVAHRVPGSPEVLPVIGDGREVRFFSRASDLRDPDGTLSHPRVAIAQHGSDAIVWWSPALIWRRPDWLKEPRARDVSRSMRWFPWVTFWQLTTDQMVSMKAPPGYGHNYGPELITGWLALLHPPGWTTADTRKLTDRMLSE